ncbi:hypothetical protein [Streptomyces canus]|uniref:hypothetical protein n=1 Tax=Streptomyces canus TaxID=58343 RepID=UPI002DDC1A72|nr:hypothetical protein [Streptomyces canus]WSD88048.1 hypothetical protein OG925_28830 [Streptomyces canus]
MTEGSEREVAKKVASKKVRLAKPLEIVGDAAIATHGFADGRMIPILIVDTATRPDLEELVRVHQHMSSGDCKSNWGRNLNDKDQVILHLEFIRPLQATVTLAFNVPTQGILVDSILMTQAFFLLPGRSGDRFVTKQESPKILIEVLRGDFSDVWEKLSRHVLRKFFRERGHGRPEARAAAELAIEKMRQLTTFRYKKMAK